MAATMEPQRGRWSVTALLALIPLIGGCGGDDVTAPISNATTSTVSMTTVALPTTTATPTTTTVEATTTEVVIPEGALDLGDGVFVPVPDGWEGTVEDGIGTLDDGTAWVSIQVLERLPGEDPALLTQAYVDTFDSDWSFVDYSPTRFVLAFDTDPAVHRYDMKYWTHDEDEAIGLLGGMSVFTRGDGLSMVLDVYTWDAVNPHGLPQQEYDQLFNSFVAAPIVDETVELEIRDPFRVASVHPTAMIDDLIGFTLAEGFDVWDGGDGYVQASNGDGDIEVFALSGMADLADAVAEAKTLVGQRYSGVAFGAETDAPEWKGWQRQAVGWSGTYTANGEASTGFFNIVLDPSSGQAYAILISWYSTADGSDPYASSTDLMYSSLLLSLDEVG